MWRWMGERAKSSEVGAGAGPRSLDRRRESFFLQEILVVRESGMMRKDDSSKSLS